MSALMTETCEQCGEEITHEKDEDGLLAIEIKFGEFVNMCLDCADEYNGMKASSYDEED